MLVGDSVLEMRRAQRPEYSLGRVRSLRKSRRHHLWLQDRPGLIAVPCAEHQDRPPLFLAQSIKAACAEQSRFSQAGTRAVSLATLAAMNLEVICDVQEVARTIAASAMTK
jgi:hypothetical protein